MIQRRSIGVAILLSLITCGIYGIYWYICMTNDVNEVSQEPGTSGGMVFLFSLLTCGIYFYYWGYSTGNKLDALRQQYNQPSGNFAILLLLLNIFGFGIISVAIVQNELNKYAA